MEFLNSKEDVEFFFYIYFNKMSKCLNFYISKFLTIKIILKKEKKN